MGLKTRVKHPPFRIYSFFGIYQNQSNRNIDDIDADVELGVIVVALCDKASYPSSNSWNNSLSANTAYFS